MRRLLTSIRLLGFAAVSLLTLAQFLEVLRRDKTARIRQHRVASFVPVLRILSGYYVKEVALCER